MLLLESMILPASVRIVFNQNEPDMNAIDWKKVTANDSSIFKDNLDKVHNYVSLAEAMLCRYHPCKNIKHRNKIDEFTNDIMNAMTDASNHLPKKRKKSKKTLKT